MYRKGDKTISIEEATSTAEAIGMSIEEWANKYGWVAEGKQEGSTEMTPTEEPLLTPAGDSSSGDISLGSQDLKPYLLTEEDLEGSEEEVYDKISPKLKAIGIDTEEYIPGADAIKLTARSGAFSSVAWATNKTAKERQEYLNKFVEQNADLSYAETAIKGRENLLKEYSTATSVNISDEDAEKDYVKSKIAEWRQKETLDFGMGQRQTIELKKNDFDTPEEFAAYTEWKQTGILEPNKAKVQENKELLIAKQKEAKGEKFVKSLEEEDKNALQAYTAKKVTDTKYRVANLNNEVDEINNMSAELNAAVEAYNKDPKSGDPVALRKMAAQWQGKVESFESFVESLDTEESKDLSLALNNLSKEYNLIKKLGIGFKSQGINLAYGGAQILSGAGYIFDAAMTDATLEENIEKSIASVQEAFQQPLQDVAREQARLAKGTSFEDALNSPGDLVNWSANAFVQAVPSLAMAFTGAAAMPLFFVSGYGGKAAEIANEEYAAAERMAENAKLLESTDITEDQRVQIESQMAEDAKLLNIPAWKEMTSSAIGGVAEVLFERLSTIRIIRGANKAINPLKPQIHKAVIKSAKEEGLSEGATQFVNNFADAALLDKDVNLFDGVGEAVAGGALVGSVLELRNAAPAVFNNISFSLATKAEISEFRKDLDKLKELTGLDDVTALLDPNVPTPPQSPEVESLVSSIVQKINNRQTNIVERIGKDLTEEDLLRIGELNIKMKRINDRYAKIALSARPSELKAAEGTLREEFDALAAEKDAILTDQQRGMDAIALNASRAINMMATFEDMLFEAEAVRQKVKAINDFDALDDVSKNERLKQTKEKYNLTNKEAIEKKAIEDYKIERNKEAIAEDEKRIQQFLEASGLSDKIKVRKLSDAEFKKLGYDKGPGETDAVIVNGEIIVNEDAAAENSRVGVFSHEVLHAITSDVLGNNGGNQAGKDLLGWLESNSPDTYVYIKARLDKLYEGNSAYYEEAMNALSDYIAEGNEVNIETIGKIQLFFNKIFKGSKAKQLSLDDAAKTFAFIAQYADKNKTSKTKELIKNFQRGLRGEDEIESKKKSLSAAAGRAQAALDKMQEEGYDPNNFELYDILNGMASAQLNKYKVKGLQITDMEEAVADVVGRLYTERDVNKFDGRGSLYGYLNGRIKFRILDAFKANPIWVEDFGDIDAEGLTGKEVQKVAVEAVETTEAPKVEEGYKNLLRRRVLEPEVVDAIKAKVMSTVRVMKTRMDESVSKNVTVKPYIAELRKAMGKQADIDLKKAMGGLKDGQLRKFLLKNKAAILENMTTTWLMTAMPNAVQKKVDGQWTSDWKGKKIDRETVATDSAGRTSGAELVRRLPKAATRMSDADFLSNFFNADGSLIRGRKESLAKAMAEEISFDIINEALQDPNSEIRKAFEMRQDLLGVELADNFVAEVSRDIERGNVKYSKTLAKAANQNSSLLGQFGEVIKSEDFKAVVRAYSDNRNFMSKSLVEYFKVNPNKLEELGLTLKDVKVIGMEINQNFSAEIKEANKIAEETAALSIRAELNDHLNNLMIDINDQVFSRDVESMLASAGINIPDVATYGGRVRAMQSLESINKGRGAVKYLVEKLGNKIFYLKGGLASPARLGGFVHAQDKSTFDGLYIKEGEVKESGRSVRFGLFLSSADFDSSLGLDGANAPNTSSLTTTKGFIQGRKWDNATLEQRKELAKAEYKQAEELKDVLIETVEVLKEGYENGDLSAEQVVMVISTIFSDAAMNSLGKASAGLRWFVVNENGDLATMQDMVNEGIAYKPGDQRLLGNNKTPKDPFVLEHTIPNRSMALRSMDLIFNNKGRAEFFAELENYNTAIIPQKVDDQVALNGFKDSMPLSHKPGDMPLKTRYKGTGLKFYDAKTGEIVNTGIQHNVREHQDAIEAMEPQTKYSQSVPRAVFMVGGPGAGKTNVGKGLKLGRRGYKVINQDLALEPMKEEAGLPANEQEYTKDQRSMRAKLGAAARKAAEEKMQKYLGLRESMVVDGTGASYNATMKKINALREAGYEVSIVFANTSKDEAIARNKARAERALPDMIVERTWEAVQESAKLYKEEFGDKFYELNTNELKLGEDLPKPFLDKLYKDLEVGEAKYSKSVSKEFNKILERKTGVASYKEFSRIQAQLRGKKKGRFKFFIHPSADDFRGLVHYAFAGKGKQGEADIAWLEEKLLTPYFRGIAAIDAMRQQIKRDFKVVTKQFREEYKLLSKQVGNSGFTYDHALRVYMWDRQGMPIEGLAKRDKTLLLDAIAKNPELVELADALLVVSRRNEWPEPTEYWEGGSILGDLNGMTEKIGRKKFLAEFIENAEIIFSEENLNKIEALFGSAHREAIEDSLYSMKNGTNRRAGTSKQVGAWLNWVNGSTGAIMFFNRRSALLQMLSFTNFINWSDNNPAMAAAAFANQKQYWKDWATIFNSDKLKERRGGLKQDVSDAELAAVANRSKNSPQAILAYLLKIGFTPTQIADSMAIATGGAMFYRNRINTYLKQGMDQAAAEEQAFLDFAKKSDEAQQSSDPALVSQQQRSVLGRMILAFANTPMQYTRLMKKAGQDLINGRGNPLENISKIAYYGFIQNFIFSALQSAMFALLFDDDEEDDEKKAAEQEKRTVRTLNSMLDTVLRGSGIYGAVASTVKNTIMEFYRQEDKGFLADHTYTLLSALNLSPPIGSKARKLYSAIQTRKFEKDNIEQRGWSLTADGRLNIGPNYFILGNVLSGVTNVPMDRVADELNSITEALDARNKTWQRIALALGWKTWDVGARNEEADLIKAAGKEKRKQEGIEKAKETRKETKKRKDEAEATEREKLRRMTPAQRAAYLRNKKK